MVAQDSSVANVKNPKQAMQSITATCLDRSHNKLDIEPQMDRINNRKWKILICGDLGRVQVARLAAAQGSNPSTSSNNNLLT